MRMLSDDELYNELQGPDAQELLAELNGANERACAVVGAARLDDLLRELLEAYIVEDRDARNQLYGVANPKPCSANLVQRLRWPMPLV